jgi:hypothetical protein
MTDLLHDELDEKFCDVIVKRYIEQTLGQRCLSDRDGETIQFGEIEHSTDKIIQFRRSKIT